MKYSKALHETKVKLFSPTGLLAVIGIIGMYIFLGTVNVSYAFSDAPPDDATEKAPSGVNNEPSQGESAPVSRDFEQMEKDDTRHTQPATTQEVPFHSTDEKAYRDAKEKR